jgi:hypothetical protein
VESEVIKAGGTICFAHSLVKANDVVVARADATEADMHPRAL